MIGLSKDEQAIYRKFEKHGKRLIRDTENGVNIEIGFHRGIKKWHVEKTNIVKHENGLNDYSSQALYVDTLKKALTESETEWTRK